MNEKMPVEQPSELFTMRDEIENLLPLGTEMVELHDLTAGIDRYAKEEASLLDLSLTALGGVLPKDLINYSKLRGMPKAEASDTYRALNDHFGQKHEQDFEILCETCKTAGVTNPSKYKTGYSLVRELQERQDLTEAEQTSLSKYIQDSWQLVILNSRFLYDLAQAVARRIEGAGLQIPIEDVYQEEMLIAYKLALFHKDSAGSFINFTSNYLPERLFNRVLRNEFLLPTDKRALLNSQSKALRYVNANDMENTSANREFLTAMYYFRLKGDIDFTYADTKEALHELIERYKAAKAYMPILSSKHFESAIPGNEMYSKLSRFFTKLHKFSNAVYTMSIDKDPITSIADDIHDGFEDSDDDEIDALYTSEPRPVELEIEENDLRELIVEKLDRLVPYGRDREIIEKIYGLGVDGFAYSREDVAIFFGLTDSRIRQIESKILRRLRNPSESYTLKDYL